MSKAKEKASEYDWASHMPDAEVKKHLDTIRDRHLNPSGIRPLEFKVLVRPVAVDTKTKGGILLPDETKERDQHATMEGTLIEASPLAFKYEEGAPVPPIGSTVIFARYSGVNVKGKDGLDYRLMNDKDVAAVRGSV